MDHRIRNVLCMQKLWQSSKKYLTDDFDLMYFYYYMYIILVIIIFSLFYIFDK